MKDGGSKPAGYDIVESCELDKMVSVDRVPLVKLRGTAFMRGNGERRDWPARLIWAVF